MMIFASAARSTGRLPAHRAQQDLGLDLVHELVGVVLGHGSHGEGHVLQRLGVDAAQAEHDHRSEETVADQTDHELALADDHVLHQHAVERGPGRRRPGFQRPVGLADLCLVADAEQHQPGVGLVLDLRWTSPSSPPGSRSRSASRTASSAECDGAALRHGDAVGGEELLAGVLVKSGGAGRERLLRSRRVQGRPRPGAVTSRCPYPVPACSGPLLVTAASLV